MSVVDLSQPATVSSDKAAPPRLKIGWIVGPGTDIPWFILGALAGYALFFLHLMIEAGTLRSWGLNWNMFTVWLIWYVLLDVPHFFGTYARTYLDKEELHNRKRLLLGSLVFPFIGPFLVLVCYVLFVSEVTAYELPFELLGVFVSLWAYWHVVRQHYGIMALYKRKNSDVAPVDQWVDKSLLYVGLLAPFVAFAIRHRSARATLFLDPNGPLPGAWDDWLLSATVVAVCTAALAFLLRQVYLWNKGEPINLPKVLFLLAVVPLHVFVCYHPGVLQADFLAFAAFVTIFHDIQYHAIVWHYQRNRIHKPGVDKKRFGLAAYVSKNFAIFMSCAIALGVGAWLLGCIVQVEIGCMQWVPVVINSTAMPLFGSFTMQHIFLGMALGFIMHHYFVDQFIWRPSKDAQLRKDLKLQ